MIYTPTYDNTFDCLPTACPSGNGHATDEAGAARRTPIDGRCVFGWVVGCGFGCGFGPFKQNNERRQTPSAMACSTCQFHVCSAECWQVLHGIYEGKYGLLPEKSKSNGKQRAESEGGSEGEDDDEGDDKGDDEDEDM